MSETPSYPAPDPAYPAPAGPGGALDKVPVAALLWAQVVGGLLVALGTFLPYATSSIEMAATPFTPAMSESESANGWDDSGGYAFFLLLLGLAVAALAFATVQKIQLPVQIPWFTSVIVAALLFLLSFIKWIDVYGEVSDAEDALNVFGGFGLEGSADVSTGIGIWLVLLGSLAAVAGAVLAAVPQFKGLKK